MNVTAIIAIIVAVIALLVAMWAVWQTQRSKRLRTRFGPEYDYTVEREGDRRKAEAELAAREAQVKRLHIRDLTPQERERFASEWRQQQSRFVENPKQAVLEADGLVTRVMTARGYPTADYETRTAYASVDHGRLIGDYREAHAIAERSRNGQANTEDLRRAMISYRRLFEDLTGSAVLSHDV
jgi:FtsZ-interacting cell division protein ZipA